MKTSIDQDRGMTIEKSKSSELMYFKVNVNYHIVTL